MTPVLGVIEGFYGAPWRWKDREGMIDFMARHGFGLYVYAPKDDRYHRVRWREPYPPDRLARFERLAERCAMADIEFVYGLTPWRLAMDDYAGIDSAWHKVQQLIDVGATGLCLSFDDLPEDVPKDPAGAMGLARWQASVANELDERMRAKRPDGRFIFTPTEYHGRGESPYLRTLGEALGPGIQVFWTGPQVCSRTISGADLAAVTHHLGRQLSSGTTIRSTTAPCAGIRISVRYRAVRPTSRPWSAASWLTRHWRRSPPRSPYTRWLPTGSTPSATTRMLPGKERWWKSRAQMRMRTRSLSLRGLPPGRLCTRNRRPSG